MHTDLQSKRSEDCPSHAYTTKELIHMIRQIRKRLGKIKCVLIDELPYHNAMRGISDQRQEYQQRLNEILPVSGVGGADAEVHMLCGTGVADMGMWASWSLMRFIPAGSFVLHSDGSLTESDVERWKRLIPRLTYVTKEERDQTCRERLDDVYPTLAEWRRKNPYSSKAIDVHFYGQRPRIIVLDSDVLCFSMPSELLRNLADPDVCFSWNEDERTSYTIDPEQLQKMVGHSVPQLFNTGVLVTKRYEEKEFAILNETIQKCIAAGSSTAGWFEQMLTAVVAGKIGNGLPLGPDYRVVPGRTKKTAVMRHYTGVKRTRFRFFKEGIPRLLES
jgi:hypothetical protein